MKICITQMRPVKGDIAANIHKHQKLIQLATFCKTDAIFFPELSLTGYEPELANNLAMNEDDKRLDIFQLSSDANNITIGLGMPTNAGTGVQIGMFIFQPYQPQQLYAKQQLHSDEMPYFVPGSTQIILKVKDTKVAPSICYESLQPGHVANAIKLRADMYVASVAKSQNGVNKGLLYYPEIAKKYAIPVLMANCVGYCDNFESAGQSAVWTKDGNLAGQLDNACEGILIYDTITEQVTKQIA